MPRPNAARLPGAEDDLARRVAYERDKRGWSTEGLAARMTAAGCPIQQSAIWKIENGKPRRRITVDELLAFAEVFGTDITGLLQPPELVISSEVHALLTEMWFLYDVKAQAEERIKQAFGRASDILREHPRASPSARALRDWVLAHPLNPFAAVTVTPHGEQISLSSGTLGGMQRELGDFIRLLHEQAQADEEGDDGEHREAR